MREQVFFFFFNLASALVSEQHFAEDSSQSLNTVSAKMLEVMLSVIKDHVDTCVHSPATMLVLELQIQGQLPFKVH